MSHQPVTYQQLLAQQYEENARDLLAYQETDYHNVEEEHGQIDAHNANNDVGEPLTDPHEFQHFGGNRNNQDIIIKPSEFKDHGKTSVRYNKDVQLDIFNIDTRFRSYAVPGLSSTPKTLIGNTKVNGKNYVSPVDSTITSLTSNYVFQIERQLRNIISATLTSFELPNRFFNLVDIRNNYYIYVKQGIYSDDNPYTQIAVYITDFNLSTSTLTQTLGPAGQNGFYYSNTSIIPALNYSLKIGGFTELSVTYVDGYCYFNNSSNSNTYVLNFTPEAPPSGSITNAQIYPTLGRMLGFTNFIYELLPTNPTITNPCPTPCDSNCGHIIVCQNNGSIAGEDLIDMNADSYIYLSVGDWNNVQHETADNSFFTVFAKVPITVDKGKLIYDIVYNNSITKTYYFQQPTNLQQFQVTLLDKTGQVLLMPNVDWSMTIELEEVLSQSLYEKMREL
jgi:hypothetical protein